jgi:hypothetical protein
MTGTPSYYAWCPSAEKKDLISVYLTAGRYRRTPDGHRAFFESVLAAAGIEGPLHLWGVHPFTTSYFTGKDWEECWDTRLVMEDKVGPVPDLVGGVPVTLDPELTSNPEDYVQVRVLADFRTRKDAEICRAALKERADRAAGDDVHYSRILIRNLGGSRKQVRCDVGSAKRDRLPRLIEAAEEARSICQRHGGRTQAEG